MLAIAETANRYGGEQCKGGDAKKSFFANPDHLLLVMCTDENEAVKKEAVDKISELKAQHKQNIEDETFLEDQVDDNL